MGGHEPGRGLVSVWCFLWGAYFFCIWMRGGEVIPLRPSATSPTLGEDGGIALAAPDYRLRFSRTQTSLDLHSTCTIVTLRVIIGCASVMLKLRLALLSTCTIVSLT